LALPLSNKTLGKNISLLFLRTHNVKHIFNSAFVIASFQIFDESQKHGVKNASRTVFFGSKVCLPQKREGFVSFKVDEKFLMSQFQQISEKSHNKYQNILILAFFL
jgi:hypothetical protein